MYYLNELYERALALEEFKKTPEFADLMHVFRRINNILRNYKPGNPEKTLVSISQTLPEI